MDNDEQPKDYDRPVAYDIDGQPLYAHPPKVENKSNYKVLAEEGKKVVSDADKLKHAKSQKVFPELDLSEGDYVISFVRRHPIGLLVPFVVGLTAIVLAFIVLFNYDIIVKSFQITGSMADQATIFWPVIIFVIFVIIAEYMVYFIYTNNKFFITNDSIIQQTQTGIFYNSEHIISLGSIKDTSYGQNGFIQQLFNYGWVRLNTEGDEAAYKFTYVFDPKECVASLDNAIENFKNDRNPY